MGTAYTFKVCMLGASGVGKTSIRRSFMGLSFVQDHRPTLGGDFSVKEVMFPDGKFIFSIWEVDPSNNFKRFRRHYLRNSFAGIIVFDVTTYEENITSIFSLVNELDLHSGSTKGKVPVFLIGNKIDLIQDIDPVKEFIEENVLTRKAFADRTVKIIFTSCVTGENINEMFYLMKVAILAYLEGESDDS